MQLVKVLFVIIIVMFIGACQSAERRSHRAQAKSSEAQTKISQERLKLVDEYKKCVEKAGDDTAKVEACDSYLKAAESLK
jgi:hypothetical protein